MSKKSGFFYAMLTVMGALFSSMAFSKGNAGGKYQPSASSGGGGGKGDVIRSYGQKPAHYKDKVLYKDQGDVIYVSVGHSYWRTRVLAEAHR